MSAALRPTTAGEVLGIVAQAAADETPLEIVGHGTKRGLGRPIQAARHLDLAGLSGVTLYEPAELVLTCLAGTPIAEIERLLDDNRQQMAFEPADLAPLYGGHPGAGTIGGAVACNLSGPRRIKAGAARDHLLGFKAVSGRGEAFKAGGRVVKNVTGYDLCKLVTGSYGTLAVLTEVTLKVLPAPETTGTVLLFGLDDALAIRAMTSALHSPHEVCGAAHLPARAAARSSVGDVRQPGLAVTAIRIEGPDRSVEHRCAVLRAELAVDGRCDVLHSEGSIRLWREVRDVAPLMPGAPAVVWRLSVPPASGAAAVADLNPRSGGGQGGGRAADYFLDWGGGLIWLALDPSEDAGATAVRAAVARNGGGHATLVRAPDPVRLAVPVFEPQGEALAALSRRVKEAFDPRRILNPGRMSTSI
jgi:glycolate oxidase FAD binding subunit